jgi:transposase
MVVTAYLQSEAVTSVPWPVTSPDLNPIEHIWDMLGRRIHAREPPVQNIRQCLPWTCLTQTLTL